MVEKTVPALKFKIYINPIQQKVLSFLALSLLRIVEVLSWWISRPPPPFLHKSGRKLTSKGDAKIALEVTLKSEARWKLKQRPHQFPIIPLPQGSCYLCSEQMRLHFASAKLIYIGLLTQGTIEQWCNDVRICPAWVVTQLLLFWASFFSVLLSLDIHSNFW